MFTRSSCHRACLFFLSLLLFGCAKAGTFPLHVRYDSPQKFPALQQKIGPKMGMAPFKDSRKEKLYIGAHTPLRGPSSYFRSDPSPLEKAISDSLSQAFLRHGIRTVSLSSWDGRPETLKNVNADSVLMIDIRDFWTEGKAGLVQTKMKTSVQLTIHLGVKKENRVFTRNVAVERETGAFKVTPEKMEETLNQTLTEIFDQFLSNPYDAR